MSIQILEIKEGNYMVFVDCEYIVNYNECCLYHFECNGCMDCKDQKPRENTGNSEDTNKE